MTKKLSKSLYYLTIIAIIILSVILFRLIKIYDICCTILDLISPVFFGYAFAWLLNPLYKYLNKKMKPKYSIALIVGMLILFYVSIVLIFIPIFTKEIGHFIEIVKTFIPKLEKIPFINVDISNFKMNPNDIISKCGGIVSIVVNLIFIHMFGFYILSNYDDINGFFKKNIPQKFRSTAHKFVNTLSSNMYLFVKGTIIDAVVLFVMSLILFSIFGIKYPILLAFFISITNIIPFIGPYIGGIPALLLGFSVNVKTGIIAILIVVFCQFVESNFINPMIMGKMIKINPLFIVVAITVMGKFFGILGMAFAIPVLIFFKILIEFLLKYKKFQLIKS